MKIIKKTFDTLKEANRFHNELLNTYDSVRVVSTPFTSEQGLYVWEVK